MGKIKIITKANTPPRPTLANARIFVFDSIPNKEPSLRKELLSNENGFAEIDLGFGSYTIQVENGLFIPFPANKSSSQKPLPFTYFSLSQEEGLSKNVIRELVFEIEFETEWAKGRRVEREQKEQLQQQKEREMQEDIRRDEAEKLRLKKETEEFNRKKAEKIGAEHERRKNFHF